MSAKARILREFDLDAPMMTREDRHQFRLASRFVTSNIEQNFDQFSNAVGAWKVLVEVVPAVNRPRTLDLLGVRAIQVIGDAHAYLSAGSSDRAKMALAWFEEGARSVFAELDWPVAPLDDAIQRVVELDFTNVMVWKAKLLNKSRTIKAEIVIEMDDVEARIVAIFRSKADARESRVLLCARQPSEFLFVPCLGKVEWLDDERLQLTSRSGSESWIAVVPRLIVGTPPSPYGFVAR